MRAFALVLAGAVAACGQPADPPREAPAPVEEPAVTPVLDDDALAERYVAVRDRVEADERVALGSDFPKLQEELRLVIDQAKDAHLRANAALLLGAIHETRGERESASEWYLHASKLVPADAGPHMALALALAKQGKHAEAAEAQQRATDLDPDNLDNWLTLGEMHMRAGDQQASAKAYAGYELRRKGLVDGLTLTKDGNYIVSVAERIACAEALAGGTDAGSSLALMYALDTDPEPTVRAAVARVMGSQRLAGYRHRLETQLGKEKDVTVREALAWALAEVVRDPVETRTLPGEFVPKADGAAPAGASAPRTDATAAAGGGTPPSGG